MSWSRRSGLLFAVACSAAACDFDIPPLPSGGGTPGGGGGAGGGGCTFVGCPECGDQQVCDPVMGCVQCIEDADCTDDESPVCDGNRCVQCTNANTDHCQDGAVCSQSRCANPCNDETQCNGGEFCPGEICEFGRCLCCKTGDDCTLDGTQACTAANLCVQCATDADCAGFDDGTKEKCRADGTCVACLVAEDCEQPAVCNTNNACELRCCTTEDCVIDSEAPICDVATSSCVACTGEGQCLQGDCVGGRCMQCADDSECTDEALPACVNSICKECSTTVDCPQGRVCFLDTNECLVQD